ncbi:MAG TPA: CheR family methyltransferase [Polyangiaceae bacterium]|nr:CheR family methyltransferase [Polyangiaceae bacterium]
MIAEFEKLLKQTMGLDAASIGSAAVECAVRARQAACKLDDIRAYWQRVSSSKAELQELIETVVVGETWFLRDREAFAALARFASEQRSRSAAPSALRLLSLPCSTGEEPYSMAMALLDAGLPAAGFRIDAVDVSGRALAYAERGVYSKNSFRGTDLGFRDRHFDAGSGYRIADAVRAPVRFQWGNLLDEGFLRDQEPYDCIFCRNVLIYFDRPTQDRAIAVLTRLLSAKGVLFVGPSETALLLSHDFVSLRVPLAFAFKKPDRAPRLRKSAAPRAGTVSPRTAPTAKRPPLQAAKRVPRSRPPAVAVAAPPSKPGLDDAKRLANLGHLAEAAKSCEKHLRDHGPSAEAFYLFGVIRDASGRHEEATEFYRKALYLEPNHHEALVHLALALENAGDNAGARVLHQRARRLEVKHGRR